jgi:hypothetical protein
MEPAQVAEMANMVKFATAAVGLPFMLLFGIPYLVSLGYTIYLGLKALVEEIRGTA